MSTVVGDGLTGEGIKGGGAILGAAAVFVVVVARGVEIL